MNAETPCPTDAWELFWHPQGRMITDGLKGSCRMISQWAEGTLRSSETIGGSHPALWQQCERRQKGKAMDLCKHIGELCRHPIGTVGHVISAGCEHKTFLPCLQLHTRRDETPPAMKTSIRHQKKNARIRTIQTLSELFL